MLIKRRANEANFNNNISFKIRHSIKENTEDYKCNYGYNLFMSRASLKGDRVTIVTIVTFISDSTSIDFEMEVVYVFPAILCFGYNSKELISFPDITNV